MAHHIQKLFQWSVKGNINVRRQGTKLSLCTTGAMLNDISASPDLINLKDPVQPEIFYDLLISAQSVRCLCS